VFVMSWVRINPVYMSRSVCTLLFHGQNGHGIVQCTEVFELLHAGGHADKEVCPYINYQLDALIIIFS